MRKSIKLACENKILYRNLVPFIKYVTSFLKIFQMISKTHLSIGTDIVDIQRIHNAVLKFKKHFLKKIFTNIEIQYCSKTINKYQSFAARFAAKEAFAKALGVGIGTNLNWHDMSVINTKSGQPIMILSNRAKILMKNFQFSDVKISLSHTKTLAQAVVILIS